MCKMDQCTVIYQSGNENEQKNAPTTMTIITCIFFPVLNTLNTYFWRRHIKMMSPKHNVGVFSIP